MTPRKIKREHGERKMNEIYNELFLHLLTTILSVCVYSLVFKCLIL